MLQVVHMLSFDIRNGSELVFKVSWIHFKILGNKLYTQQFIF